MKIYGKEGERKMNNRNLTLLTDLYELTMMQGYFERGDNETVVFDVFFRSNPNHNGYSIAAGPEQVIDYIKNLHFTYDDVETQNQFLDQEDPLGKGMAIHPTIVAWRIPWSEEPNEPVCGVIKSWT